MNWYKKSQQEAFPFHEEITYPPPPDPFYRNSPKTKEFLEQILYDPKGFDSITNVLNTYNFNWKKIQFPNDIIIKITLDNGKEYLLEDDDFNNPEDSLKDPKEWLQNLYENDLYNYIPPIDFNEEFWNEVESGYYLYHATSPENTESITKKGLSPLDKTRGINNRFTGSAIFTSNNPYDIASYGDAVIEINVGQMKKDGYMPTVSKEGPLEEADVRQQLAGKLGLHDTDFSSEYASEGLYDTTIIFYSTIPPKYLRVL